MYLPKKYIDNVLSSCEFLELLIKIFFTTISLSLFGSAGFVFARLFKFGYILTLSIILITSISMTAYLKWWLIDFWNFMYKDYIKKYVPKKKKKMRDK